MQRVDENQEKGIGGAVGDERLESHTVFSPTLGVYISPAPSASDALKDQWQHTVRSNTTVLTKLVNKPDFQKNAFLYRSQVKHILLDLHHTGDNCFSVLQTKYTLLFTIKSPPLGSVLKMYFTAKCWHEEKRQNESGRVQKFHVLKRK